MGIKDVVLLEQHQVTAGTTWHAAGLMVTFGSLSETSTEMRKYSKKLYNELESETGHSTGFKPVGNMSFQFPILKFLLPLMSLLYIGFIELAADAHRLEEYRRIASFNRKHGVDVVEIGPQDVLNLFPLCRVDDILAGFYVKDDGRVNPVDATMSLAKGAKMKGVKILEGVEVTGVTEVIHNGNRRVSGVTLADGKTIEAEYVVNCAGMWARQLGELSGVNIPNQAAEHYYVITDSMPEVSHTWPVIEDPSSYTYIRPEGSGLMVGLFEPIAAPWNVKKIPNNFKFGEITPDWERMGPFVEKAMNRVPSTLTAGIKTFFCGPESFTPDLAPCIGESPEIKNYFVAAGL
jgi:glycine/D-amino acid oxidase-like deaminating enzyme